MLLLLACASFLPVAHGAEGAGDATHAYELERYASAVTGVERDLLSLIETASDEDRFDLYRTYNQLMGAWIQVDLLQSQLDLAIAAAPGADEDAVRTTLRDQADFVRWELDHAIAHFTKNMPEDKQQNHLWVNEVVRSLLAEVRVAVNGLLADQCARASCAPDP
jgi:hypothetical protein